MKTHLRFFGSAAYRAKRFVSRREAKLPGLYNLKAGELVRFGGNALLMGAAEFFYSVTTSTMECIGSLSTVK